MAERLLIIACGALAREIDQLRKLRGWEHVDLRCIDAKLHNTPARIPAAVRARIREHRAAYRHIFVAYADCGTGGNLDRVLREESVERLDGAHCYQLLAGAAVFDRLAEAEPGTFYLTDFLARHFQRLVAEPLQLDRHPELRDMYFGNYRRLVYLSQTLDDSLQLAARHAAHYLGLEYQHVHGGYGELETRLDYAVMTRDAHEKNIRLLA